jgi:hypothetical protein
MYLHSLQIRGAHYRSLVELNRRKMSFEKTLKLQVRRFAKHKMSVFQRFHFTWEQTGLASENENVFLEFEPFFPRPLWFLQKIIDSDETDKKMKERGEHKQTKGRKSNSQRIRER